MSNSKEEKFGEITNEPVEGLTPSEEDIENLREKYDHQITLCIYFGKTKDGLPSFGFIGAGEDERKKNAAYKLGKHIHDFLTDYFNSFMNR